METLNHYDITLLDDDMIILPLPAYTAPKRPLYTNEKESTSFVLIRSALDRLYNRDYEMPYILQQWAD